MKNPSSPLHLWLLILLTIGVAILSAHLRFTELDRHPFHADEAATGAQSLAYRLDPTEEGGYRFDPTHGHGPMLTALAAPICKLRSQTTWATLDSHTLRAVTAACGLLASLGAFVLGLGWCRALVAAGLAATSPLLVYYSRFFIHEPVFLLFAIPALTGLFLLFHSRAKIDWLGAGLLGLGAGAMAATRETVAIALFAWAVASLLYLVRRERHVGTFTAKSLLASPPYRSLLVAAILCLVVIFLFYSSHGRHPSGFITFFTTYFEYKTGEGHDKPFLYFFHLLTWPKHIVGRWWCEGGILLLALCVYLDRSQTHAARLGRFLCEAGLIYLLIFSVIAYKTPWLASLGWLHLCFAGGCGAVAILQKLSSWWRLIPILPILWIMYWQTTQTKFASIRLAADGRNPYAYVPTSRDTIRLGTWLNDLRQSLPETKNDPIAVVGQEYWPLPWHLRQSGQIGYWPELNNEVSQLPVLILMPTLPRESIDSLKTTHTQIPRGLRDEFPVFIAIRNDLWSTYQAQ